MKKYLLLAEQISAINQQFSLKPNEIELLDAVAKAHVNNESIIVSDLIHNRAAASSATLHAVLKGLSRKGLIATKEDQQDGRKKAVSLTKKSLDRYKRLGRLVGT